MPVPDPHFAYTGAYRCCLWCNGPLTAEQAFFDSDLCGRLFAEQWAARGVRLHAEELVNVNG